MKTGKRITMVLLVAGLVSFFSACGKKEEETVKKPVVRPIKIMAATSSSDAMSRRFPGRVRASKRVDLSFRVQGPLVELPAEEVPMFQKKIIYEAYRRGRPVITATQMLESMINSPRPTRAEASDVANAILDGSDAVMLSGETAVGKYPVESVATMARIASHTESRQHKTPWRFPPGSSLLERHSMARAIAKSACQTADELDARYVIVFTESGGTARLVSHFRPNRPILALSPSELVCRQLTLPWGITPILSVHYEQLEQMLEESLDVLKEKGLVEAGDLAVVIFGTTLMRGGTNVMKIHSF